LIVIGVRFCIPQPSQHLVHPAQPLPLDELNEKAIRDGWGRIE